MLFVLHIFFTEYCQTEYLHMLAAASNQDSGRVLKVKWQGGKLRYDDAVSQEQRDLFFAVRAEIFPLVYQ